MTTFQIARADGKTLEIQGKMANRHGLIAGATGDPAPYGGSLQQRGRSRIFG